MSAAPDSIRFHHPYEAEERPYRLVSLYTEDTVPNDPVTDMAQAMHIVLKHVTEFIANDTEDPFVRYCCLVADLGYKIPEEGFWALVDDYHETMTPEYADYYNETLRDYLGPYTKEAA